MSDDEASQQNVLEGLRWSPHVNATHIGVAVRNGVVELTGHVETFAEKLEAEHVALSIRAMRNCLSLRLPFGVAIPRSSKIARS